MFVNPLIWAFILTILAFGIIFLEMFIPSHGILGFLSLICLIGAIFFAFRQSNSAGVGFILFSIVGIPITVVALIRWWPNTSLGRKIVPEITLADEMLPDHHELQALVGMAAVAQSVMLPSGPIKIEGKTIDATSGSMAIEKGQMVIITEVRGNQVIVRPINENDEIVAEKPKKTPDNPDDILSRPIDSLGLDPLDDPLA